MGENPSTGVCMAELPRCSPEPGHDIVNWLQLLLFRRSVVSDPSDPVAYRPGSLYPWNFPGTSTGEWVAVSSSS